MKLRAFLKQEKLTVAAFGGMVGVPNKQTVSRYVRGERFPPPTLVLKIEKATNGEVLFLDLAEQRAEYERMKKAAARGRPPAGVGAVLREADRPRTPSRILTSRRMTQRSPP